MYTRTYTRTHTGGSGGGAAAERGDYGAGEHSHKSHKSAP